MVQDSDPVHREWEHVDDCGWWRVEGCQPAGGEGIVVGSHGRIAVVASLVVSAVGSFEFVHAEERDGESGSSC